jgi:hypothetical protein
MFSKLMRLFRSPASTPLRRARLEVETLESRAVPAVLALGNDGNLWQENFVSRTWVDGNVWSFQQGSDGYDYVLGTDGNLWQEQPGWQTWGRTWVDGNVQSFLHGSDGFDYVLGRDGNLWQELPYWQNLGRTLVDHNVQSFTQGCDGYFYVVDTSGYLWKELPGSSTWSPLLLEAGVQSCQHGSDGYDYVLYPGGGLWKESHGDTISSYIRVDSNVRSFALGNDGYKYVLSTGGNLYKELNYATRTLLETNVWSFDRGSDGYNYVVIRDGKLWKELSGTSPIFIDSNVRGAAYGTDNFSLLLDLHPAAATAYSPAGGTLFGPNGPSYLDVQQGNEADCWLLASSAEVAARVPADIRNMFTYDGTAVENGSQVAVYSVRLYTSSGVAEYVTVDTELPSGGGYYDHPVGGTGAVNGSASPVLWPALLEKAYAEADGVGMETTRVSGVNSYDALGNLPDAYGNTGGVAMWALHAITGQPTSWENINLTDVVSAWNAGKLVVLCTQNPPNSFVQPHHYYALVGCIPSYSLFQVFNPYGTDANNWQPGSSGQKYGLVWGDAGFLLMNFTTQEYGAGGGPGGVFHEPGDDNLFGSGPANAGMATTAGGPTTSSQASDDRSPAIGAGVYRAETFPHALTPNAGRQGFAARRHHRAGKTRPADELAVTGFADLRDQ